MGVRRLPSSSQESRSPLAKDFVLHIIEPDRNQPSAPSSNGFTSVEDFLRTFRSVRREMIDRMFPRSLH